MKTIREKALLENMNEVSLLLNDLAVYLEKHPSDRQAAEWFDSCSIARKELLDVFEKEAWRG